MVISWCSVSCLNICMGHYAESLVSSRKVVFKFTGFNSSSTLSFDSMKAPAGLLGANSSISQISFRMQNRGSIVNFL